MDFRRVLIAHKIGAKHMLLVAIEWICLATDACISSAIEMVTPERYAELKEMEAKCPEVWADMLLSVVLLSD
jgi:hypothetical protein